MKSLLNIQRRILRTCFLCKMKVMKNWFLTFCKVRKNDTLFIESMSDGLYSNNGVFIDIFPLDYKKKYGSFFFEKNMC